MLLFRILIFFGSFFDYGAILHVVMDDACLAGYAYGLVLYDVTMHLNNLYLFLVVRHCQPPRKPLATTAVKLRGVCLLKSTDCNLM